MDEFDKCNFCMKYDNYEGCTDWFCTNKESFKPSKEKIIDKARALEMSVADVVALINLEG